MRAKRLPDGRIRIPTVVHDLDGGLVHGTRDVDPGDPLYDAYDSWLRQESLQYDTREGVV